AVVPVRLPGGGWRLTGPTFIMIFDPDTLLALLASPLWFLALWAFWKLKQRREGQLQLDNQSA
ncbi:hypothetical protein ACTFJT_23265, partial [Klebsiella quasipneumoniae]